MANSKLTDHNATPLDDGTGLRGGTEGGGTAHLIDPDMPSQASVGSAAGSEDQAPARGDGGSALRGDDADPIDAGIRRDAQGLRHPSPAEVSRAARDAADIPPGLSRPGFNEGDPAVERKEGRSDGNMPQESKRTPAERGDGTPPKQLGGNGG